MSACGIAAPPVVVKSREAGGDVVPTTTLSGSIRPTFDAVLPAEHADSNPTDSTATAAPNALMGKRLFLRCGDLKLHRYGRAPHTAQLGLDHVAPIAILRVLDGFTLGRESPHFEPPHRVALGNVQKLCLASCRRRRLCCAGSVVDDHAFVEKLLVHRLLARNEREESLSELEREHEPFQQDRGLIRRADADNLHYRVIDLKVERLRDILGRGLARDPEDPLARFLLCLREKGGGGDQRVEAVGLRGFQNERTPPAPGRNQTVAAERCDRLADGAA